MKWSSNGCGSTNPTRIFSWLNPEALIDGGVGGGWRVNILFQPFRIVRQRLIFSGFHTDVDHDPFLLFDFWIWRGVWCLWAPFCSYFRCCWFVCLLFRWVCVWERLRGGVEEDGGWVGWGVGWFCVFDGAREWLRDSGIFASASGLYLPAGRWCIGRRERKQKRQKATRNWQTHAHTSAI